MNEYWERLNTWHLELSILADAMDYALQAMEEPTGAIAVAHVLKRQFAELVESCPFPNDGGPCHD